MVSTEFSPLPAGYGVVDGVTAIAGIPGTLTFSGLGDDYLDVAHSPELALANGTMALTFTLDDTTGAKTLFSKDATGNGEDGHVSAIIGEGVLYLRLQSDTEDRWVTTAGCRAATSTGTGIDRKRPKTPNCLRQRATLKPAI